MERLTERNKDGKAITKTLDFQLLIDKLAGYEDLEEQGLLLRLPCNKGTPYWTFETQYWINEEKCKGCKHYFDLATESFCNCNEDYPACTQIVEKYFLNTLEIVSLMKQFGKTVFLTKEEAEAALEKTNTEEKLYQSSITDELGVRVPSLKEAEAFITPADASRACSEGRLDMLGEVE